MNNTDSVFVLVELTSKKELVAGSLEALSLGVNLKGWLHGELCVVLLGSGVSEIAEELKYYGADKIYVVDNPLLEVYQPDYYVAAFAQLCAKINPKAIVMGDTLTSVDFAPRVAFTLGTGLITDCVAFRVDGDRPLFTKPVYSGNVMAEYTLDTEPYMVTIRSRSAELCSRRDTPNGEIMPIDVDISATEVKTPIVERVIDKSDGPRLVEADVVVAGGRGIGGAQGFELLSDLAHVLGGTLGASRPPCDLGWVSPKTQIGQTGEIVGPSLYIAVGISGSTQHIAGMSGSKKIVAINKDSRANIFKIADYGVEGNYEEILPAFKDEITSY